MDLQIVTLEITNLIIAVDHFDSLVFDLLSKNPNLNEEYQKIQSKSREHLSGFFGATAFYDEHNKLKALAAVKDDIKARLNDIKTKDIHELVEKLEKDAKKMKKLYKAVKG